MLHSWRFKLSIVSTVLLVLALPAEQCLGVSRTWDGGGSGSEWANPVNWDPNGYSSSDNLTVLSGSPTSTVNVSADNAGTITLDGSAAIADFSENLYIAYSNGSAGSLDVLNGAEVSSTSGWLGCGHGASGTATVSGAGSAWTNNSGYFTVGYYGTGTLSITSGGAVSNAIGFLGYESGSSGTVTVSGADSAWTNSCELFVGYYGTGTLSITSGGTVSNAVGYVGSSDSTASGEVTVSGAGLTWTNIYELYVGYYGTGVLIITDGGTVSNLDGYLGYNSGSSGTATVSGAGSAWTNSGNLSVGGSGTGELTVNNGGIVEVGGTMKVWGTGTLNVGATGTVNIGNALVLAQDSTLTTEPGAVIHITGSAFQNESTNAANLAGLGNLKMIFEGGTGDVDPFEVAGEDMGIVMGGFVESNFVLGALQLGGIDAGRIQLVDYFDNQDDGSLGNEALYVETLTINSGSCIDLNGLNLYFKKDGNAKKLYYGDADVDGQVADSDLSLLLSNWNKSVGWPEGDFNCDGAVTDADLSLLLSNWGAGVSGPASDVPEPAALGLLVLGGLAVLKRRRRA